MLTIRDGELFFDETHLLEDKITNFEGIEARYRELNINVLLHIVSDPTCRYESNFGKGRISPRFAKLTARERFLSILQSKELLGNPKGYYINKHRVGIDALDNDLIKSVSFAYCGMDQVSRHFSARASKYGIVFFHDFLNNRGIREVRYINDEEDPALRSLLFNSPHLLESYSQKYDMRWENEWRIQGQLSFSEEDVAFLIVPDEEYDEFIGLQIGEQIGEYGILPASVFDHPVRFLLMAHRLEHHSWSQIEILAGLLVDFDMFPLSTEVEMNEINKRCGFWIDCLRKAEIQEFYEHRYISKFLKFACSLNEQALPAAFRGRLEAISANAGEPSATHRDLMMACYGEMFYIQKDRINL